MVLSGLECPVMQLEGKQPERKHRHFKQHVELMFTGPLKSRNEAEKCSYLLIWVGQKGRHIYNTWTDISEDDRQKPQTYYDGFENHISLKSNPVFARFKFHSGTQDTLGTAEKFIAALQMLVQDCDFKDPDEMIRDQIVFGTKSFKVREKLISKGAKLTSDKAIEIARSFESSQTHLTATAPENVNGSIHHKVKGYPHQKHPVPYQPSYKPPKRTNPCRNCGSPRKASVRCPACGQACLYCKKLGHFAEVCQSKASRQQIHTVEGSGSAVAKSPFEDIILSLSPSRI